MAIAINVRWIEEEEAMEHGGRVSIGSLIS